MTHMSRSRARATRPPAPPVPPRTAVRLAALAAVLAVTAAGAALLAGCAERSPAQAGVEAVRLTTDGTMKMHPVVSPDGKQVAYAAVGTGGERELGVYVVPAGGGKPTRISPDSIAVYPVAWATEGGLHCLSVDGRTLYRVGLDGSATVTKRTATLARLVDVSPDGRTELLLYFNRDNHDLALRRDDGELEPLAVTTQWEEGGVLGPGPGEVTAVAAPFYQAPDKVISVWDPAKREFAPLPLPDGQKYQPAWSPEGRRLSFTVYRGGQADVWLYEPSTGRSAPVVEDPDDSGCPAWFPDGRSLVFCRGTKTSHLYAGLRGDPARRAITDGPARDYAPIVSPDGRWIAFSRRPAPGAGAPEGPVLCVVSADGGEVREIDLHGLRVPGKSMQMVTWSPDSEELAFSASEGGARLDVYRIRRDGSGLARVTVDPGDEVEPQWSTDGRHISYTQVGGGRTQVAVVPSNGGLARVVSAEGVVSEGGAWTPDAKRLAYLSVAEDGGYELWLVSPERPEDRRLLLRDKALAWPYRWTPDGGRLVMIRGQSLDWRFVSFDPETGNEFEVAREARDEGGAEYVQLLPAGERYRSLFFPAGVILADGEQSSDLYRIEVRPPAKGRLASRAETRLSWIASIGSAESY